MQGEVQPCRVGVTRCRERCSRAGFMPGWGDKMQGEVQPCPWRAEKMQGEVQPCRVG